MFYLCVIKENINREYNIDKLLYLLIDRPDKINVIFSSYSWYNNKNQLHRDYDLPANTWPDGDAVWLRYNVCHRENNKPARYWFHKIEYWVNGNKVEEW